MAGRPKKRQMMQKIEDRAAAAGLSLAEFVFDFIGDGKTMTHLAKELGYSRSYLSRHLNAIPEVQEALKGARLESADVMAEQTIIFSDTLANEADNGKDIKSERVAILREQTSARKWWAAMANPERYGKQDTNLNINLGDLHLDALRKTKSNVIDITPSEETKDE